ncbi:25896_t:CDS:2 [Gigaspora margarita]|uniref:25896_t:CDS:1 n=1 Tax=Gigaspora margarita TaxID=4874 RepID=A0ABM8VZX6_GIGMA|nr:25896_t:CDS:2 [Gigaspora margarita]
MAFLSVPSSDVEFNEPTSFSEAETSASTNSIPLKNRKKRKNNKHGKTYCKICEQKFASTKKELYPYSCKGGTTSNIATHLREKHGITKQNFRDYLNTNVEPKENLMFVPQCSKIRQKELSQLLSKFMVKFVEPLYILQDKDFREFVLGYEPGFRIPCNKTAQKLIHEAYLWSTDQLNNLIKNTAISVHLTTDLWTAKILLTCNVLDYPNTSEIISEELYRVIQQWHLTTPISPLDVLLDTKTRWNSTFIAWKRLHNSIRLVSASLLIKQDCASQKEGEKLDKLCLTSEEKA